MNSTTAGMTDTPPALATDLDNLFQIFCGMWVLFAHVGYIFREWGAVHGERIAKLLDTTHSVDDSLFAYVVIRTVACVVASMLAFYVCGAALAYGGGDDNAWFGFTNFALSEEPRDGSGLPLFFQRMARATLLSSIFSPAMAERARLLGNIIVSVCVAAIIHPVVLHWTHDTEGWLSPFRPDPLLSGNSSSNGLIDFAYAGSLHVVGGFTALVCAIAVGPRDGRFSTNDVGEVKLVHVLMGRSAGLHAAGVLLLWLGFNGLNAAAVTSLENRTGIVGRVITNTAVSACASVAAVALYTRVWHARLSRSPRALAHAVSGTFLAGIVAVSSCCATVDMWQAFIVGAIGGFIYRAAQALLLRQGVDDAVHSCAIHGFTGFWSLLAAGIFARQKNITQVYGKENTAYGDTEQVGLQIVAAMAITVFTLVSSWVLVKLLLRCNLLRLRLATHWVDELQAEAKRSPIMRPRVGPPPQSRSPSMVSVGIAASHRRLTGRPPVMLDQSSVHVAVQSPDGTEVESKPHLDEQPDMEFAPSEAKPETDNHAETKPSFIAPEPIL